jgi:hypothetical protein
MAREIKDRYKIVGCLGYAIHRTLNSDMLLKIIHYLSLDSCRSVRMASLGGLAHFASYSSPHPKNARRKCNDASGPSAVRSFF